MGWGSLFVAGVVLLVGGCLSRVLVWLACLLGLLACLLATMDTYLPVLPVLSSGSVSGSAVHTGIPYTTTHFILFFPFSLFSSVFFVQDVLLVHGRGLFICWDGYPVKTLCE